MFDDERWMIHYWQMDGSHSRLFTDNTMHAAILDAQEREREGTVKLFVIYQKAHSGWMEASLEDTLEYLTNLE